MRSLFIPEQKSIANYLKTVQQKNNNLFFYGVGPKLCSISNDEERMDDGVLQFLLGIDDKFTKPRTL